MNNPTEQMRESFEAWAREHFAHWMISGILFNRKEGGDYYVTNVQDCFNGYEAAHAQLMPLLVEVREALSEAAAYVPHHHGPITHLMQNALTKLNAAIGEGK